MCELCAIRHFSACFAAIATCSMFAHTCTHACNLSASRLLAACGAKVQHENHSDKLLCENFTMKRIFRQKASFMPHRFRPNVTPYVSEAEWFTPHGMAEGYAHCKAKHTQIGPIHSTGLFCLACTQDGRQGIACIHGISTCNMHLLHAI